MFFLINRNFRNSYLLFAGGNALYSSLTENLKMVVDLRT